MRSFLGCIAFILFLLIPKLVLGQDTYLDNFGVRAYNNSDGTVDWSTNPWTEVNDNNSATNGYIRVTSGGELRFREIYDNLEYITRTANLSSYAYATLSFDWRTANLEVGDDLDVQVSSDGTNFTTIFTINGTGSNTSDTFTADITSYISATTTIRFINNNGDWLNSNDTVFIDDVQITAYTGPDLVITKTVDNSTPKEESNIIYTLSIQNNGPINATNVSLTDILPAGITYVSDDGSYNSGTGVWTVGTLNDGSTATLNITASVNFGTNGSTITNTITALSADQSDSNITLDDLTESIVPTIDQAPTLTVTGDQLYCPTTSQPIVETINITDPDDTTTDAIYVQISSGYVNGEDLLNLTGTHPNITATWDVTEGELALAGPATFSEFEAAIRDVEFSSSSVSPSGVRQFSITPGSANYLPPTNHYYEFVPDVGITWTAARDAAALRTYYGLQGYLATLTTQEEADFSGSQAAGAGWIGASDATTEGDWQWVTGPEAGTSFWSGTSTGTTVAPYNFAYWNGGEPNQSGNEDYAHITDPSVVRGTGGPGSWNDLSNTGAGSGAYQPKGYIVEYGGTVGDPVLNITGVTTLTIDNVNPTGSNPLPVTVNCSSDIPSSDITVVTDEADNCTTNPVVTFVSDSSNGGSNPEIITRTYRVTDEAGNFVDVTQTITVNPILIDSQPTNQIVGIGSNGTFSSSTSNADTFQWQVSTNSGASFSNISNGSEYSGTTTEVLTVLSADLNKDGYIYRLLVSNSSGSCATIVSSEVTLTVVQDSDSDGIDDLSDLDDDNDGILDSVESPKTVLWVTDTGSGPDSEEQNTINKLIALGYSVTVVDDSGSGQDANNYSVTFIHEESISGNVLASGSVSNLITTANGVITSEPALHDDLLGASVGGSSGLTSVDIIDNAHPITNGLSLASLNIGNALYHGNGLITGTVLGRDPGNSEASIVLWNEGDAMEVGTAPGKRVIVPHTNGFNTAGEDLLVNAIVWTAGVDSDGDGITDNLDLDSDNDGIYDAIEAGHDQAQTFGRLTSNVGLDGVPDTVQASGQEESGTVNYTLQNSDGLGESDYIALDSDGDGCNDVREAGYTESGTISGELAGTGYNSATGIVTGNTDGYTNPLDGNNNLIFDYREVGIAPSISIQPVNEQTCPGCSVSFSVLSSNTDNYQWQQFNGITWDDLSDGGIFSGTTTNTLTITAPTASNNGDEYRVIVSNSSFSCITETSNTVVLALAVTTVITNRRITYRVKRN